MNISPSNLTSSVCPHNLYEKIDMKKRYIYFDFYYIWHIKRTFFTLEKQLYVFEVRCLFFFLVLLVQIKITSMNPALLPLK